MIRFRRKKQQLPVSFFAFQDIITALAGTLLIIVLVIAYGKSRSAGDLPPAVGGTSGEYSNLQQIIKLRKAELTAARNNLTELQLRRRQAQEDSRIQKYNQQLRQSFQQNSTLLAHRQQQLQTLQSQREQLQKALQALDTPLQELLALQSTITVLERKLTDSTNTLQLIPDNLKNTLVLDCSRSCWQLATPDQPTPQTLGQDDPTPQRAYQELCNILKMLSPENHRLLIAVRPSAGAFAQALKEQLRSDFPRWEIIAEPTSSENTGGIKL